MFIQEKLFKDYFRKQEKHSLRNQQYFPEVGRPIAQV